MVEVSNEYGIQVEKVTCAVDCGIAVNPSTIRAQMEGGIGYGIGHAILDEITLENGEVQQSNFPDYEPLRIGGIREIDVHIVPSTEAPDRSRRAGRSARCRGAGQCDCESDRHAGDGNTRCKIRSILREARLRITYWRSPQGLRQLLPEFRLPIQAN